MRFFRFSKTSSGRFNGRWSFGHKLWLDYKEIALDLRHRTREIQHKRGIGEHPDEMPTEARLDSRYLTASQPLEMGGDEIDNEDEADTIDGGYQERRLPFKVIITICFLNVLHTYMNSPLFQICRWYNQWRMTCTGFRSKTLWIFSHVL